MSKYIFIYKKTTDFSVVYACEAMSYSHRGKPPTTIGAIELNFRVRYGNGCDLYAIITSLVSASNTRRYSLSTAFVRSVTYGSTLLLSLSCFLD